MQARALTGHFDANNFSNCPLSARACIARAYDNNIQRLRAVGVPARKPPGARLPG